MSRKRRHSPYDGARKRHILDDGHMDVRTGDYLIAHDTDSYEVIKRLGEGAFGRVYECHLEGRTVAIKIIKNITQYRNAAQEERKILRCIKERTRSQQHGCFPLHLHNRRSLNSQARDAVVSNSFIPFTIDTIRSISYQCLEALAFLHRNMITHTDIKPENILFSQFVDARKKYSNPPEIEVLNPQIKMIDFGSATFDWDHHTRIVTTRHYRAPEVILETGWSHPCDMWSIAFVFLELYTGETTFQTHDNIEHLALMEALLGPIPSSLLLRSPKRYSNSAGQLLWPDLAKDRESITHVRNRPDSLQSYFTSLSEDQQLLTLIEDMISYEPADRSTAIELLQHEFFTSPIATSGNEKRTSP
eukprot:gene9345-1608_t